MPAVRFPSRTTPGQLFQRPVERTRLPRFARHPLARIALAVFFLLPVVLLNNAFSFLVLDALDEPLLSAVQFPKAVLLLWLLMVSYGAYCRRIEGRPAFELGGDGWAREFAAGAAVGGGMVALLVGALALAGCYGVESLNDPFVLVVRAFRYGQGAFLEELLFTVILFRLLEEHAGTLAAVVAASLLFGLLHLGNDHATPATSLFIALQEIALLAPFILTRRIWMSWAVHFAWNYAQTAVFGLGNSGMAHGGLITPVVSGPDWLTGGDFGIEASWPSLALNLAVALLLLELARRRGQLVAPSWRRAAEAGR